MIKEVSANVWRYELYKKSHCTGRVKAGGGLVLDDEFVKGMLHVENGWIHELYVDSFFQNQGIGARLIGFAIEKLHAKNLMVLEKNHAAIRFYRAHGFSMTKDRRLEEGTEEFVVRMER